MFEVHRIHYACLHILVLFGWKQRYCESLDFTHISEAEIPRIYRQPLVRIIKGQTAPDSRYTFAQVTLQLDVPNNNDIKEHQCGGSLIAPDIVLSAGHCLQWFTHLHVDQYDFTDPFDSFYSFQAEKLTVHPLFESDTFRYDFMIIKLNSPMPLTQPVRLNNNPSVPFDGMELSVLGWGTTDISDPANPIYPSKLQKGILNAITNVDCENTVVNGKALYTDEIFPEMMCTSSEGGVDACAGDSGGPLILEGSSEGLDLLVGLVSWGRGCAIYPGVYSRVSSGYDWIRSQVCLMSAKPPSYLGCSDSERDPKYLGETWAATVTPTTPYPAPTAAPTTAAPVVVADKKQHSVSPTTMEAVVEANNDQAEALVVLEIQLDDKSEETGWHILRTDGTMVLERPAGTYADTPSALIMEEISLDLDTEYYFVLADTGGDGICCTSAGRGWFRLSLKKENRVDANLAVPILIGNGVFGRTSRNPFKTDSNLINPQKSTSPPQTSQSSQSLNTMNGNNNDGKFNAVSGDENSSPNADANSHNLEETTSEKLGRLFDQQSSSSIQSSTIASTILIVLGAFYLYC